MSTPNNNAKKSKTPSPTKSETKQEKLENEKAVLNWRCSSKETNSSRLRREMNAGKGIRGRSKTIENADVSTLVKEELTEQKKMVKSQGDLIEEMERKNELLQEMLTVNKVKLEECLKVGVKKGEKLQQLDKEKSDVITELEELRFQNKQLQMKISSMEDNQGNFDSSVESLLKDVEGKNRELVELREIIERERRDKSNVFDEYAMKVQDHSAMSEALQREVALLKAELDEQVTTTSVVKNNLEVKLNERAADINTLMEEKTKLEQACEQYEIEIRDRIRENLSMMDDYDNAKAMEHKQLSFINEITKSNQDLTTTVRKQQKELAELNTKLQELENEINEERNSSVETSNSLDTAQKKNKKLEDSMEQSIQALVGKDDMISRLVKYKDELEAKLKEVKEKSNLSSMSRDQYKRELKIIENQQRQTAEEYQKEKGNFDKRDKEQTEFLNQLVKDLENCKGKLLEKTQMVHDVGIELTSEIEKGNTTSEYQLGTIKDLERQLNETENKLASKEGQIDKLSKENRKINEKLVQKLEALESLKHENISYKARVESVDQISEKLKEELDKITANYQDKENECHDLKRNIQIFEETNEQQGEIFSDLRNQNDVLKADSAKLQGEANKLKEKIGECVEKYSNEIVRLKESNSSTIDDIQKELQNSRTKSQQEINELLDNFNEVEKELRFCQEEITTKSRQLDEVRSQLAVMTESTMSKEQKLLQDLETLNEQNENALQSEIKKHKVERENQLFALQKQNSDEMNKIQNECQAKLTSLRDQHDREKTAALEMLKSYHSEKVLKVEAERKKYKEELENKSFGYSKIENELESKLRSKDAELTSKNRIIDQLGRRIETQQKLIEYMMKSLEMERSKQTTSNGDIMRMLSNLQTTIDDKLETSDVFQSRTTSSLSSFSEAILSPQLQQITSHSSPSRQRESASEAVVSPLPSPTLSPVRETFIKEDFSRYLVSSPSCTDEMSNLAVNLMYPWSKPKDNHKNDQQLMLNKSMPESGFVDMGYVSPTMEKNTNTRTIYFGEQMQTIMRTFEKIEAIQTDNSPNKELNLDIWKQKIHFRLKVLEDQMTEIDGGASPYDDGSSEKYNSLKDQQSNILFHPSTQEIRELIDNVNRRYQNLGRKYLSKSFPC